MSIGSFVKKTDRVLAVKHLQALFFTFTIVLASISLYTENLWIFFPWIILSSIMLTYHFKDDKPWLLVPNWITFFRLLLLLGITLFWYTLSLIELSVFVFPIVILDFIDGFTAKRFGMKSEFGAIFDAETDALFILVISIIFVFKYELSFWLTGMGFLRFIYGLYFIVIPASINSESVRIGNRNLYSVIAGSVLVLLALCTLLTVIWVNRLLLLCNLLLVFSFVHSFYSQKTL